MQDFLTARICIDVMDTKNNIDTTAHVNINNLPVGERERESYIILIIPFESGCRLLVAYEMTETRKTGPYTYILDSALTEHQGRAPPNAVNTTLLKNTPVDSKA